jgi:hypothetical protein
MERKTETAVVISGVAVPQNLFLDLTDPGVMIDRLALVIRMNRTGLAICIMEGAWVSFEFSIRKRGSQNEEKRKMDVYM